MSKKFHKEQGKTYTNTIEQEQDVLKFLASTANDLIVRPFTEIDDAVTQALTRFSQLVDADRSAILQLDEESMTLQMTYEWCKEGINPHLQACRHMSISSTPVMSSMLHQDSSLMTANVASMPDTPMKKLFIDQGIEHLIMIPLHSHQQPIGMVFFELMHEYGGISELTKQMLPVFGQMVANAISRKIANEHTHKLTRRLDVVLSRSGIGTWELDLQTGRFSWDDMMCRLYGMEPGSFSGNYNDWANRLHPDDRPWAEDTLGYGRSDLAQEALVFRIVLPSQEIRYIKASSTIIYDDNSTPLRILGTNIDVTAEKKAELKVREAHKENTLLRERMELALDAAHIGIWEYNIEKNSLEWDQWMYALYGITQNQFSGAYQAWEKGLHPADKASAIHALEEAIAGRKPFTPTFRVIHPSGAVRYLKASATIIRDDNGTPLRMIGTNRDVTAEQEAQLTLKHERDLFSAGPVFIIEWEPSPDWPIRFVTKNVQTSLGYSQKEMTSPEFSYRELIHPDDAKLIAGEVAEHMAAGRDMFEQSYRLKRKDGTYRWFYDVKKLQRDPSTNQVLSIHGYMYDHTEQKEAEALLIKSRKRLQAVIDGTRAGTWQWNVQTGETWFNEQWAAILGYTLDEIRPLSIETWMKFAHPDDLGKSGQLLDTHFRGDSDYYEFECRMRHRDGHWIWVLDRGRVTEWSNDGKPLMMSGTHQDITERKRLEATAHEKSNELEALYNGLKDVVIIADIETRQVVGCNAVAEQVTGMSTSELCRKTVEDLHPPEVLGETLRQFNLQARGKIKSIESEFIGRNGQRIPVNISTSLIEYRGRRCLMGVFRDITEIRQAAEQIRASNQQLEASNQQLQAMNQQYEATNQQLHAAELQLRSKQALHRLLTTISLSLMRAEKGLDHALQKALKMIGSHIRADRSYIFEFTADGTALSNTYEWCAEGIESQQDKLQSVPVAELPWWMSEHSDLQPIFIPDVATLPQEASREKELLESQGIRSLLALPMAEDGEFIGFLGLDWVTRHSRSLREEHIQLLQLAGDLVFGELRRKHSADALQRREQKYRSIFENIQDVYAEVEAGTGLITEVSPSIAQFGYQREEVLYTHLQQYYAVPEERELLYQALEQTSRLSDFEVHLRKKNGSIRTCAFTVELLQGSNGEPPKVVGTMRDITERASHEAQMKENLQLKNDFISMVSHELRTPLFSILGFSSMLLKDNATLDADTRSEFLSIIHDESTRLSSLIEDVLTISRIDAGKSKYQPVVISPASLVNDTVKTLLRASQEKGVAVITELPDNPPTITFDKDAFKQVLMNLVSNGIKFTPKGGEVRITLNDQEGRVVLTVSDTGMGIPQEDLPSIFDKFYRSHHSAQHAQGTGLGLAIVKDIVEIHGGKITTSSVIDKGSSFKVSLPLAPPSKPDNPEDA